MSDWIEDTLDSDGVLKNKLGIKNAADLRQKEYFLSASNAALFLNMEPKIKDISDMKKIHKILFGQLYDWAGKYRPGDFSKNGFAFFEYKKFDNAEFFINDLIKKQPDKDPLRTADYAALLESINYMHPFREGNGRACKVFLLGYAANHGQTIEYPRNDEKMITHLQSANVAEIAQLIKIEDTPTRSAAFKIMAYNSLPNKTQNELKAKYAKQDKTRITRKDKDNDLEL